MKKIMILIFMIITFAGSNAWAANQAIFNNYSYVDSNSQLNLEHVGDLSGVRAISVNSGNAVVVGNISGATYGSDSSISDAELLYINTLSSNAQTQLDARCLESVFGTAIGTGLILDVATLKTSLGLQSISGLTETANSMIYATADNTYAILATNATATNKFLRSVSSGVPSWEILGTGDIPDLSGTYQPLAAALTSISGLTETNGGIPYGTADNTYAWLAAGAEGTLLMGNGAAAPSWLAAGSSGYFLIGAGNADPVWTSQPTLASLEGLTIAAGTLLYGTGADTLAALGAGATTQILVGGGAAAPVWTTVTGTGPPVCAGYPTFSLDSATTNALVPISVFSLTSSGTPAIGLGPEIEFKVETTAGAPGNQEVIATIGAYASDVGAGVEDGVLAFKTMTGGAAATTKMTITGDGDVGIGSTSPDSIFEINDSDDGTFQNIITMGVGGDPGIDNIKHRFVIATQTNANRQIYLVSNVSDITSMNRDSNSYGGALLKLCPNDNDAEAGSGISFFTSLLAGGDLISRLAILQNGLVGVSTTVPTKSLEVNSATGANLRLTYDDADGGAANYADLETTATGDLKITPSGGDGHLAGNFFQKYTITTDNTDGVGTHLIAEMAGKLIRRGTGNELTGNVVDVTDTAANIVAGIPGCIVGSGFEFSIANEDSTHTVSLDGGVGVTMVPNDPATPIPVNSTGRFLLVVTNATPASEAVSIHSLGSSAH